MLYAPTVLLLLEQLTGITEAYLDFAKYQLKLSQVSEWAEV